MQRLMLLAKRKLLLVFLTFDYFLHTLYFIYTLTLILVVFPCLLSLTLILIDRLPHYTTHILKNN